MKTRIISLCIVFCFSVESLLMVGCKNQSEPITSTTNNNGTPDDPNGTPDVISPIPKDLPAMVIPANNPMTPEKIELGRHLFWDTRLSVNNTVSCGSCHNPARGFSDPNENSVSPGVFQKRGKRNAMALTNVAFNQHYVWDGRFKTLEDHAPGPIFNPDEMGFSDGTNKDSSGGYSPTGDTTILFRTLDGEPKYNIMFKKAFGDAKITTNRIALAIASFERTIVSHSSAFDRYNNGDKSALNVYAKRGFALFIDPNKANCVGCHNGANFSDGEFHSTGLETEYKDKGRFSITKDQNDIGKFRTPSLRNVALTAPYTHDGSYKDIESLIRNYAVGGKHNANQDPLVKARTLSDQDVADIAAFLHTLTDETFAANKAFTNPWK